MVYGKSKSQTGLAEDGKSKTISGGTDINGGDEREKNKQWEQASAA